MTRSAISPNIDPHKNGEIDKRLLLVHALADPRSNYCEKTINLDKSIVFTWPVHSQYKVGVYPKEDVSKATAVHWYLV